MGAPALHLSQGASYLVIPNLYSCDPKNEDECAKALAMNQLAGVLDDLDLVRWPQAAKVVEAAEGRARQAEGGGERGKPD